MSSVRAANARAPTGNPAQPPAIPTGSQNHPPPTTDDGRQELEHMETCGRNPPVPIRDRDSPDQQDCRPRSYKDGVDQDGDSGSFDAKHWLWVV